MELDARHYARYSLTDSALEKWRQHACLNRFTSSQCEASYAAAIPFLQSAAQGLVQFHSWRQLAPPSDAAIFCIQAPAGSDTILTLPSTYRALFEHSQHCERMFDKVFTVHQNQEDGRLYVAEPLTDMFHLLQLLAPGCLMLVKAEYATHEIDDEGEVAWITWRTYVRALPPVPWMDLHDQQSPQLVEIFGASRWGALRRAAADSEVMASGDITFG